MRELFGPLLLVCLVLTFAATAFGAAFQIFEQGAKATGMAGAFTATANDPSAIFYNPAGLAQQRHSMLLLGTTIAQPTVRFTGGMAGMPPAQGQSEKHYYSRPNLYVAIPAAHNVTFGLGVYEPFGSRTDWPEQWVGQFIATDSEMETLSVNPAIAWQTTDGRVAIGGGLEYRRAKLALNANTGTLNPFNGYYQAIASSRLDGDWGSHLGWNAGVLLKPAPKVRIGVSYRSAIEVDFKGQAVTKQILTNTPLDAFVPSQLPPNQGYDSGLSFPAVASAGLAFSPNARWDFELDYNRITWSKFKEIAVAFEKTPAGNFAHEQNFHDTSTYRLGMNHRLGERWDVRLGVVHDKTPQAVEVVNPVQSDANRTGTTVGLGYHRGAWQLDVAYMSLNYATRSTEGKNVFGFNGEFENQARHWGVNFGYRF